MIWLELPKGPVYTFSKSDNGSLPYKNQFQAGLMFGSDQEPCFLSTIVELMDYVDNYYEFLEPYINK